MADIETLDTQPASNAGNLNEPVVKQVPPHYNLKAGDDDPELGKKIREIILSTEQFVVYIDEATTIQWRTTDDHKPSDHCGEVLNLVGTLEAQSAFLDGRPSLFDYRRRIAEGLARCLDGHPKEASIAILNEVALELKARNKEVSWQWYFQSSYIVTVVLAALFVILWLCRDSVRTEIGGNAFEVILGTICGSFGALLFATARSDRLIIDANAGINLHRLEGLARTGAGVIGALLIALAIKAGLILGAATFPGSKFALLLCLCIVAGASERVVPNIIATLEKTVAGDNRERRSTRSTKAQSK